MFRGGGGGGGNDARRGARLGPAPRRGSAGPVSRTARRPQLPSASPLPRNGSLPEWRIAITASVP